MRIAISGLERSACAAYLPSPWPDDALSWIAPDQFLRLGEADQAQTGLDKAERLVWLYRAPWSLTADLERSDAADGVALRLSRWYRHQRTALSIRRTLGERVILVNADRVSGAELFAKLALAVVQPPSSATEEPADDRLGTGLAKLFGWSLPHYWDLFEDLEAAAWLPRGEPLFRHTLPPETIEGMERFMQTLQGGLRFPATDAALADKTEELAQLQTRQRDTEATLANERQKLAELRERLTQRIDALESDLEQASAEGAVLREERDRLEAAVTSERGRVSEQAQALSASREELAATKQAAAEMEQAKTALKAQQRALAEEASAREQALTQENERLSAEVHHLKDALEGQSSANRELRARLARSTETLDRARVQLCRQLARGGLG